MSVLNALGDEARGLSSESTFLTSSVSGARIWVPGEPIPEGDLLLVVPSAAVSIKNIRTLLKTQRPLAVALCGALSTDVDEGSLASGPHAVIVIPTVDGASTAIATVNELLDPARESEFRKLTSLQRSFSQALNHPTPVTELLKRLQRQTAAVCLVVDLQGRVRESTGTIPLGLLLDQVRMTDTETQRVSASGWEGLAIRLQPMADAHASESGWLIAAARREGFPDAHSAAAVHIAATLVESARRTLVTARAQEEAIRAAIFDEALELDPRPDAPELASRLAALGFNLGTPLRVLAVAGTHPSLLSRTAQQEIKRSVERALDNAELPFLSTSRGGAAVLLAQGEAEAISRILRVRHEGSPAYLAGVGREVKSVADVAQSLSDALIAIRALRAGRQNGTTMSWEQFDFSTRVLASIGLERMAEYSRELLEPLLKREPMLEALRVYFRHAQNISAAADALGIHHNTLRYRLSKVEEALNLDLNEPAAVTALFLATAAIELVADDSAKHLTSGTTGGELEEGMTLTGIAPPDDGRAPSESITRSRPPRASQY